MNKFLKQVEKHYSKSKKEIMKILNPNIHYLIKYDKENYNLILIFDKKTNQLLFSAEYQYLGIYNKKTELFYWAHTLVKDQRLVEKSKSIQKKLKKEELGFNITESNFQIKKKNLEELIKIIIYLTKSLWFFQLDLNNELVQFISIEGFLEKYI